MCYGPPMMNVPRALQSTLVHRLTTDRRIVLLFGPRQVGKTTLAKAVLSEVASEQFLALTSEDPLRQSNRDHRSTDPGDGVF